jgi:hypothetical protein
MIYIKFMKQILNNQIKNILIAIVLIAVMVVLIKYSSPVESTQTKIPTVTPIPPVLAPQTISIPDSPLKQSIIAAGDYLVRQQLSNGEISYQVDILTGAREYSPSYVRLIAGTGALFTVCRVSGDSKYCDAGNLALDHYLEELIIDPKHFPGACFYTTGNCQLGGSALAVDAIYKRWQATGNFRLGDRDLSTIAKNLGYFIVSMRKPEGGFYHAFDPHYAGTVDPDYFVSFFPGESLLALMELYEMTGNEFWLTQAREVDDYMITQPATEDHWHSYAFSMFARLDKLTEADKVYAKQIADTVIAGQVRSLNPTNTSIATATKIESLASLAQAFLPANEDHEWLDPQIRTFITFVRARQLPDNNCNWVVTEDMQDKFRGGIFSSCEEPSIRVDGLQHYINGITVYLEYQSMLK